jgi:hypothetical protein
MGRQDRHKARTHAKSGNVVGAALGAFSFTAVDALAKRLVDVLVLAS